MKIKTGFLAAGILAVSTVGAFAQFATGYVSPTEKAFTADNRSPVVEAYDVGALKPHTPNVDRLAKMTFIKRWVCDQVNARRGTKLPCVLVSEVEK